MWQRAATEVLLKREHNGTMIFVLKVPLVIKIFYCHYTFRGKEIN